MHHFSTPDSQVGVMCAFCCRSPVTEDVEVEGRVFEVCAPCARKLQTRRRQKDADCFCPEDCPRHVEHGSY